MFTNNVKLGKNIYEIKVDIILLLIYRLKLFFLIFENIVNQFKNPKFRKNM